MADNSAGSSKCSRLTMTSKQAMADNSEGSSKGVQEEQVDYSDQFSHLVFMVNEINRAECSDVTNLNLNKLFLAGYIPRCEYRSDIIECIHDLPQEFSYLEETSQAASSEGNKEPKRAPIELPSFLVLLGELRKGLTSGTIHGSARWDILKLFLNITGPRRDAICRVLFYLYHPPGPFVPKEEPDGPSALADAKNLYPLENLALSLVYRPMFLLKKKEYSRYFSNWEKVRQRIENDSYGKAESEKSMKKITKAFSVSETLIQMIPKIPWPHLSDESSAVGAPTTPTRKSSTDQKVSGRST